MTFLANIKTYRVHYERGNSSELEHVVHTHVQGTSYLIFTSVSSVDRWVLVTQVQDRRGAPSIR